MIVKTSCRQKKSYFCLIKKENITLDLNNRTDRFFRTFRLKSRKGIRGSENDQTIKSGQHDKYLWVESNKKQFHSDFLEDSTILNLSPNSTLCHWSVPRQTTFFYISLYLFSFIFNAKLNLSQRSTYCLVRPTRLDSHAGLRPRRLTGRFRFADRSNDLTFPRTILDQCSIYEWRVEEALSSRTDVFIFQLCRINSANINVRLSFDWSRWRGINSFHRGNSRRIFLRNDDDKISFRGR